MKPFRVVSYYARPSTFTTGGVNPSRLEWHLRLTQHYGRKGLSISAQGGLTDPPKAGIEQIRLRHLGSGRTTMLPLGLRRVLADDDLLMLHEGWTFSNIWAAAVARILKVPYTVTPHGVYEPRIVVLQRYRRPRALAERWVLQGAAAVHLFWESEREAIRCIAPRAHVVVAPTGADLPPNMPVPVLDEGTEPFFLFLGRMDIQHKGLDLLIEAVALIPTEARPKVRLVGPDHMGDTVKIHELISAQGLQSIVSVHPPVHGRDKDLLLLRCRALVHPARWESFGHSIVEAAVLGAPIILSSCCHIASALKGLSSVRVAEANAAALALALQQPPSRSTEAVWRSELEGRLSWPKAIMAFAEGVGT